MDDYCNSCGKSDVPLRVGQNGHTICDDCSYAELQDEMDEFELIQNTRIRLRKDRPRRLIVLSTMGDGKPTHHPRLEVVR